MAVQKLRGSVQLALREAPVRTQDFVPRVPSGGNQHHDHPAVGEQPHARVLEHRFAHRRRYDDPEAIRDFRQNVPGALGNFHGIRGSAHLAADPFFVRRTDGRLRGDLLREETIRRGGGHAPCRCMRLVEVTSVFQVRHDVADGGGAEDFLEALGDGARRHGLARFDIRAHDTRQNLAVTAFLERGGPHSSTLLRVLTLL